MSIKLRLLLYFGLLSAAGAVVFVIFWFYGIPQTGIEGIQASEYRRAMVTVEAMNDKERDAYEQWFVNRRRELFLFGKSELFSTFGKEDVPRQLQRRVSLERQLNLIKESNAGAYKYLYLFDPNNEKLIASTNPNWQAPPASHQALLQESRQPGLNEFVYILNEENTSSVVIANQVLATDVDGNPSGEISAILVASVGLHAPLKGEDQILLQTLGNSGAIMLVDESKKILASSSAKDIDSDAQFLAQKIEIGSEGSKILKVPDGREFQMAFRHLHLGAANSLSIMTIRSSDEALASIRANFLRMVILGIFIFFLAMSLVLFASNRIATTEKQIRELNANLEERVEQRTRELEETNIDLHETLLNLQKTKADLVQSEKLASLGSLVAGVAHELNTPIGNALLVASTAQEETKTFVQNNQQTVSRKQFEKYVQSMQSGMRMLVINLERSAELITNFKQLAIDQTSDQRRQFQLIAIVDEVLTSLKPSFKKLPFTIEVDIPADLILNSFPGPLSRIFINCFNNAVLHGFDGRESGTITVSAKKIDAETIEILFADDGVGMSDHVMRHVFDPFFTTKLGQGGNGLGMHIAYNTVTSLLGGQIELKSSEQAGCCFRMILPIAAPLTSTESDQ